MKVKINPEKAHQFDEARDMTPGVEYIVLAIEANNYLIVPDRVGPYLYPRDLFEIVDPTPSPDWITTFGEDGEEYSLPLVFSKPNFFNDYYSNHHIDAINAFNKYIEPLGIRLPRIVNPEGKIIRNSSPSHGT